MKKVITFIKESFDELKNKVTWPKFSELQASSRLVLVASLIFAVIVGLVDFMFKNVMEAFYNSFNK